MQYDFRLRDLSLRAQGAPIVGVKTTARSVETEDGRVPAIRRKEPAQNRTCIPEAFGWGEAGGGRGGAGGLL